MTQLDYPVVSVVIPAFNSARHIGPAIESVLCQDYPAIETIVVDDGSTDNTCEVVARFGAQVRLLNQTNQGSAAARNLGIQSARGHYIAFLDADDVWWTHKLRTQVEALLATGHAMTYSRFIWWRAGVDGRFSDPGAEFTERSNPNVSQGAIVTGSPYAELLLDCVVWTSTVLVERTAIERVGGFDTTLRKGQDYDLWLRLSREVTMLGMDIPTALYRVHDGGITSSIRAVNYEYLILSRAVERWGETGPDGRAAPPRLVSERLARSIMNHGVAHLRRGDAAIAVQSLTLAIRHRGISLRLAGLWLAAVGKRCWSALRTPARQAKS